MIWTVAGVGCDEIVRANPRGRLYSRWHALAFAISNGVKDADSILAAYRTLTSGLQQMQPMQLGGNVLSMPSFTTDNHKYDMLFEQGVFVR